MNEKYIHTPLICVDGFDPVAYEQFKREVINMEPDIVQVQNPKTKRWVKCDKTSGEILEYSDDETPFDNIIIQKTLC